MANFEIRPRFKRIVNLSESEITNLLEKALEENDASSVIGYISDHHVFLKIPEKDRHYWSPELHLEIDAQKESSLIRGLFGPRPSVWFMYIFFYTLLGFISMVILIMGFSQLNLGLPARILWVMPILLLLFILAFSTAKAGQKLGHDEMHTLYDFVEDALEKKWERV
jgi:hypothetical protein